VLAGGARADQAPLAHGSLLAVRVFSDGSWRVIDLTTGRTRWRLPPGPLDGRLVVHRDGNLLTWFDAETGARVGDAVLQAHGTFALVGASRDGRTAVLARTQTRSTTFVLVTQTGERQVERPGHWQFDALSGRRLSLSHGSTSEMRRGTVSSVSGRYRCTLVTVSAGNVAVEVLDTVRGRRTTVRLPGSGSADAAMTYVLVPDVDDRQLWAVSPGYGRIVRIDLATSSVAFSYAFRPGRWNVVPAVGALAPDGEHIAFSDGLHVWLAVPATRRVIREPQHATVALGWAPDQSRLWVVGERSRVSPLRLRLR
jgi:hypothetical protein